MLTADPTLPAAASNVLLQYGAIGVMVLGLAWFAWTSIQRERRRADDAETRLAALQEKLVTDLVPAMTRATDAVERLTSLAPELLVLSKRGS